MILRDGEEGEEGPAGELRARLSALHEEGRQMADAFRRLDRGRDWHPFIPSDYGRVEQTLSSLMQPGMRFLEWGSATGIITITADLIGYDAAGIEIDPDLVSTARGMAARFGSAAAFSAGSFLPAGYSWESDTGDRRLGTIGHGESGYDELGRDLEEFDLVFGYPWGGEEPVMLDLMRRRGGRDARLLLYCTDGIHIYRSGERVG